MDSRRIIFKTAWTTLIPITPIPNTTQSTAGTVFQLRLLNFKKHNGGKIYANAHAEVAPISSNTAPRSQVNKASDVAARTKPVENSTWRFRFQGALG